MFASATTADPSFLEQIGPTLVAIVLTGIITAIVGVVSNRTGQRSAQTLAEDARVAELRRWYREERLRVATDLITASIDAWDEAVNYASVAVQLHVNDDGDLEAPEDEASAARRTDVTEEDVRDAVDGAHGELRAVATALNRLRLLGPDEIVEAAEVVYESLGDALDHISIGFFPDSDGLRVAVARNHFTDVARAALPL